MKALRAVILTTLLIFTTLGVTTNKAHAISDEKLTALLTISAYGAGGGALLGVAAMAFGASPRAIFQGASLGLYAGIAFGAYVVFSHSYTQKAKGYDEQGYPALGPYQGEEETEETYSPSQYEYWNSYYSEKASKNETMWGSKMNEPDQPVFYMNFVQFQF